MVAGRPRGEPRPAAADLNPESNALYDYTEWEWFTGPESGAERTVCGPYVDYLCSDEYVLTLSAPVLVAGAFAGVAAADVFARTFENEVVPALREIPAPAFVVNAPGRVMASNTASWPPAPSTGRPRLRGPPVQRRRRRARGRAVSGRPGGG